MSIHFPSLQLVSSWDLLSILGEEIFIWLEDWVEGSLNRIELEKTHFHEHLVSIEQSVITIDDNRPLIFSGPRLYSQLSIECSLPKLTQVESIAASRLWEDTKRSKVFLCILGFSLLSSQVFHLLKSLLLVSRSLDEVALEDRSKVCHIRNFFAELSWSPSW